MMFEMYHHFILVQFSSEMLLSSPTLNGLLLSTIVDKNQAFFHSMSITIIPTIYHVHFFALESSSKVHVILSNDELRMSKFHPWHGSRSLISIGYCFIRN